MTIIAASVVFVDLIKFQSIIVSPVFTILADVPTARTVNAGKDARAPVRGRPARMKVGMSGTTVYAFADGDVRYPFGRYRKLASTKKFSKKSSYAVTR